MTFAILCRYSYRQRSLGLNGVLRRWFGQPAAETHPHLVQEGEVTPGLFKHEFHQRRTNLMQMIAQRVMRNQEDSSIPSDHIVIIPSASKQYMTHDIPYPFRQNTDFQYLCGFLEPNSILVLETNSQQLPNHTSTLFVPKKDPHRELWDGARSGMEGAIHLAGVDFAFNVDDFQRYLNCYVRDHNSKYFAWYDYRKPVHLDYHQNHISEFLKSNRYGAVESPRSLIQALRVIKSNAEQKLMQKTCDIASKAFVDVMKFSHSGVNESHLYAKMDYECRLRGADMLAYPPVVAGGNRANTIHYISNNQLVQGGELVLMDAGCECHGYSSDITRTWPVSGEFTGPQWEVYEAVLEVQEKCVQVCGQDGMTMENIFLHMLDALGIQLQRLGVVSSSVKGINLQRTAREFCPHHVSHYLGMDVHDTDEIPRNARLHPGMCITIEPGLYFPETNMDIPKELRGIGVRIEDDVLITADCPVNMTAHCPKYPDDIEAVMKEPQKTL